ncbi:hypothetical protein EDM27_14575 [Staphylococcus aureus]|nr:hypothetical protein EDM27_14575 [Staphylococcus aureus]
MPRQASEGVNAVAKCVQQREGRPGEDRPRHPTGCQGDPEGKQEGISPIGKKQEGKKEGWQQRKKKGWSR